MRRFCAAPRAAATVLLAAAAAAAVGGCGSTPEADTDRAFLRPPQELMQSASSSLRPTALFPTGAGSHWQMRVHEGRRIVTENVANVGTRRVDGVDGVLREIRRDGKVYRQEVYAVDEKSLRYVSAGERGQFHLSPPMPILSYPIAEGNGVSWEGYIVGGKGIRIAARAFSRITGRATLKTEAGSFDTYRVDTNLIALVDGQEVEFPATRWLAPGAGMVREQYLAAEEMVRKEVLRYVIAAGGAK